MPSKYILKVGKAMKVSQHVCIDQHPEEIAKDEDLPPLVGCVQKYKEENLAGFKHELNRKYCHLIKSFEAFYNLASYARYKTMLYREATAQPGAITQVRKDDGTLSTVYNTCSYNYLNLATNKNGIDEVINCIKKYGLGCYINRSKEDLYIFSQLEQKLIQFTQTEDCIIHGMGYDTNAMCIPCLPDQNTVIISDSMNHCSLIKGIQYSKAKKMIFKHNDYQDLENKLIQAESIGIKTIIVVVEGLYSMEGTYVDLHAIHKLKNKHQFLLFVDEAHSFGCLGKTGRGIGELQNECDIIDIHMGTFSKTFGSVGGFIAGKHNLIEQIRQNTYFYNNYVGLCPAYAQQILTTLDQVNEKLTNQLRENSIYMRKLLTDAGCILYGPYDSPVIPLVLYNPINMNKIYHYLLDRKITVVMVGYPVTPLLSSRIRICMNAQFTKEDIEYIAGHFKSMAEYYRKDFLHQSKLLSK